ncbi:MAG: hypothetical protein HYR55_13365 [Acidobacteria bacterium]|nr:hypothetical protein [Acidobacteriota bacterium]
MDWLARLSTPIPDKWEQRVRYYGWSSNRPRGERKPAQKGPAESVLVPDPESEFDFKKEARQRWARLIKKVYEVDPLVCPNGSGRIRIISFIEEAAVIGRILRSRLCRDGWWLRAPHGRRPPRTTQRPP